ncbi:hypothetical protein FRC07_013917 [Ceratobasidium sp. 392]|nr:hypothetical protein FRC07_013917 [Ceratobasidium sp. 392]
MKATGLISILLFAHAAFAQATDSTSVAVSTSDSSSVDPTTSASVVASTASETSTPTSVDVSSSASSTPSTTKTGTKTGTKSSAHGSSDPVSTSTANNAAPTGSINWKDGTETLSSNDGNPLIPDGISATCSTFLNKFNSDTAISSCVTPLLNALSTFTSSGSGASSAVTKTLNNLCSSNACSTSMLRSKLSEFKDACADELTSSDPNEIVVRNYDTFYALGPFKSAICSKNPDTQAYCALGAGSSSSGSSRRSLAPSSDVLYARDHLADTYVSRKRGSTQTVLVPNLDTYRNSHLMYLFISPDMNAGELCTECTQAILGKYAAWASAVPYALGLKNSHMLGGQSEMWSAIQDKCPANFMAEINNAANTANASGASRIAAGSTLTMFAGAFAALVVLA